MTDTVTQAPYRASRVRRLNLPSGARDVRIVHELDGIREQVLPDRLLQIGQTLWSAWTQHPRFAHPDLLLGLDAGGIPPTVALAVTTGLPYRLAWKLDLDLPHKHRFIEPHAHRTDVYTYGNLAGARVLLVDDEITTGCTLSNLITVLHENSVDVVGIACLVEDTSHSARTLLDEQAVPLCALTRL